ncbi:hypothetical protein JTE90_029137 [Oedothorax gibbosus]|uniref:Methyltransferase-like protein 9 n=1 Tax=Oedothorax gibbosus TaxID=931172 RepID=A0AAV6UHZ1_9ARAC|nr:hypothetical protein JTE90_029137 [Oedothorax gibbosus]
MDDIFFLKENLLLLGPQWFLGRGSMFVFSSAQFENLVLPYAHLRGRWATEGNMLDLGAGDGKVTSVMARNFRHTYVTEMSGVMGRILSSQNFRLLDVDRWTLDGPDHFELISCLNLLDRCDNPLTLLRQIRVKLDPENGILILALVLPLNQYVESGSKYHRPSETIPVQGKTFEEQVSSLVRTLFEPAGFRVERWSRLPYLCEGDLDQAFYWLNDALFVLRPCTGS